jgi:hypothetical protein
MVTIHEILTLKKFSAFRLIAGLKGLDRMVIRGGFIDHESVEDLMKSNIANEMIFSNLPMIKGKPEQIVNYVKALIDAETACFVIKTTLFKEFPKEAIDLANEYNYPIFLFDDIYIDKLILDIDMLVKDKMKLNKKIALIEKIQRETMTYEEIKSCAHELNNNFEDYLMVCFLKKTKINIIKFDIEMSRSLFGLNTLILPINDLYIAIISSRTDNLNKDIIVQKLGLKSENYHIGASSVVNDYGLLAQLINEAKTALKYVCYKDEFIKSFKEIGIYQILLNVVNQSKSIYFYKEIINIIIDYDKINKSNLLETAVAYINSDASIKKTAEVLFQHENTIRFRIRKIKTILKLEQYEGLQYETLALAIHLYELDKNKFKFESL